MPRKVWLVRHGQTDWNRQHRYTSSADRPLTPYGQRQAQALARFFAPRQVDVIVHSGLSRPEFTAQAIAAGRPLPLAADLRWREVAHGDWEGLTYRQVLQRYPQDAARRAADPLHHAPQGGESLARMADRVRQAWDDLIRQYAGLRVVVVTHAGPIQALLCMTMGVPLIQHWRWRVDLGSASALDCYPNTTILRVLNYLPPLSERGC
jgi:2,3-bisphosphoglycerate-dependent phosphoglycerate mutase/probable phosphoglycerate mutase